MTDHRVTARIIRTETGETHHEYRVGGVVYADLADVEAALNN